MAFPSTYNFNYYRGDTAQFVARPKNANDGSSFDLTGYTGIFKIANVRGSSGTQISATATVNDTTDIVTCTISSSVGRNLLPGTYVYDVQISSNTQVFTLLTGTITVTDDISGAV
jgi:hypothetical protein